MATISTNNSTELALIARMRARDESAVAELDATYRARIQQLALRYPYRVQRLVLGCTSPGPRLGGRLRPSGVARLLAAFALPAKLRQRLVAEVTLSLGPGRRREEVLRRWEELGDLWLQVLFHAQLNTSRRGGSTVS